MSAGHFLRLSVAVFAATLAFNVGTYAKYRGSVVTSYHEGPTNASGHHYSLGDVAVEADGTVHFHISLDGGTPEAPGHIMTAILRNAAGDQIGRWDVAQFAELRASDIVDDFSYNVFKAMAFGLSTEMGASATITLSPASTQWQRVGLSHFYC